MTPRKIFLSFVLLALFAAIPFAYAQIQDDTDGEWKPDDESPLVVELFTATNCSACMTADRVLYDISKMKNVIALGCHINYWDDQTMMDPTGLEECTYRQWAYRSSGMMGSTNIRVPHFMVNGYYSVNNSQTRQIYNRMGLANHSNHKPALVMMEWKDKDTVSIHMPNANRKIDARDSFSVWLIRYQDYMIQKVDMGQTAGRVLRFTNVVREAKHIAKWHGKQRSIEVDVDTPPGGAERGGYVVMIHAINGSEIIAAGKLPDYRTDEAKPVAQQTPAAPGPTPLPATPLSDEQPRTQTQPTATDEPPIKGPILQ